VRYAAPMNRTLLPSVLLPFLLAACDGNVVVDGSSGSTSGAGGSTTTGAGGAVGTSVGAGTSFGPTGVGGSQTVTTVASTGAGAGGSTSANCSSADTFFQVVSRSVVSTLTVSCAGFDGSNPPLPVPFGQETLGGVSSNPGTLTIEGCENAGNNSPGIVVSASGAFTPGTYMVSGATYILMPPANPGSGTLTLDEVGPVGGLVVGSFVLGASPTQVVGKFSVCRAHDIDVP
jgi:hypothetical protein